MEGSPIQQLLEAVDTRDIDRAMALVAPRVRLLSADGRRAEGDEAVRDLLTAFLAQLHSTDHRITAQWHQGDVWIAEVDADYELRDHLRMKALPRAFVVRMTDAAIADVRVYGAHEHALTEHRTGEEGMWVGTHWVPPL